MKKLKNINYKNKMPKIHGLVYVFVGLFASVLSWKLNYQKLIFFFYAGLVFILIGIIKIILNLREKKNDKTRSLHHKLQHQTHQIKYCSNCGYTIRLHGKFCGRCGARI